MPEPTTSEAASPVTTEDQVIRERVKGLTSQALQQGRIDPEAVKDIVRTVIGGTPGNMAVSGAVARELFADAVRKLDEALMKSASAAHNALQHLAAREGLQRQRLEGSAGQPEEAGTGLRGCGEPRRGGDDRQPPS